MAPDGPGPGRHAVCGVLAVLATPAPGHIVCADHTCDAPLRVDIHYQLVLGQRARARVWLVTLTRALTASSRVL